MLKFFVVSCLIACCLAAISTPSRYGKKPTRKPVHNTPVQHTPVHNTPIHAVAQTVGNFIGVKSQINDIQPDGSYVFSYETETGDKFEQNGALKTVGDAEVIGVDGSYSYTGDDGHVYAVSYTADENGFRPVGDHIPQVPEYIARSLVYIAEHPYVEE